MTFLNPIFCGFFFQGVLEVCQPKMIQDAHLMVSSGKKCSANRHTSESCGILGGLLRTSSEWVIAEEMGWADSLLLCVRVHVSISHTKASRSIARRSQSKDCCVGVCRCPTRPACAPPRTTRLCLTSPLRLFLLRLPLLGDTRDTTAHGRSVGGLMVVVIVVVISGVIADRLISRRRDGESL